MCGRFLNSITAGVTAAVAAGAGDPGICNGPLADFCNKIGHNRPSEPFCN